MYVPQERLAQLATAVLLMYVMIFSNGMKSIVGCNIRHALTNNFIIQHIIAFVILLFFIVITTKETNQGALGKNLIFSIMVYIWFAMLTRVRVETFVFVLILLLAAYAIGKFAARDNKPDSKKQKVQTAQKLQALLTVVAVLTTMVAFIQYIQHKKTKYGEAFRWHMFFTKPPKCRQCKVINSKCV